MSSSKGFSFKKMRICTWKSMIKQTVDKINLFIWNLRQDLWTVFSETKGKTIYFLQLPWDLLEDILHILTPAPSKIFREKSMSWNIFERHVSE